MGKVHGNKRVYRPTYTEWRNIGWFKIVAEVTQQLRKCCNEAGLSLTTQDCYLTVWSIDWQDGRGYFLCQSTPDYNSVSLFGGPGMPNKHPLGRVSQPNKFEKSQFSLRSEISFAFITRLPIPKGTGASKWSAVQAVYFSLVIGRQQTAYQTVVSRVVLLTKVQVHSLTRGGELLRR